MKLFETGAEWAGKKPTHSKSAEYHCQSEDTETGWWDLQQPTRLCLGLFLLNVFTGSLNMGMWIYCPHKWQNSNRAQAIWVTGAWNRPKRQPAHLANTVIRVSHHIKGPPVLGLRRPSERSGRIEQFFHLDYPFEDTLCSRKVQTIRGASQEDRCWVARLWEDRDESPSSTGEGLVQEARRGRRWSSTAGGQAQVQAANHCVCH